ncbi:MAG: 2-hydroxyacyl-CoA dehydratase [Ruminococcus sp.]|jgi:predicted nucleotide-binding protein (sugar kinase/HSP70/actin superfamily)|nr:2-hydroxyacyl-CoA dehydratase [Ruminococcus sp.]
MAELVYDNGRLLFTEEMRKEYTILIPMMLPLHFKMLEQIFNSHGYKAELLYTTGRKVVDEGLRNVHNDTCYPALLVIGQLIDALRSGKYDKRKVALMITQTGGGCRASNYISLLRKALIKNGLEYVPVVSLNFVGLERNPGWKITPSMFKDMIVGICYADLMVWLANQVRPYEQTPGITDRLCERWTKYLCETDFKLTEYRKNLTQIVKDFESIPYTPKDLPKVGIVGEVYIKFAPLGNNNLEQFLRKEGCEVVITGLLDMVLFMADHNIVETELYKMNYGKYIVYAGAKVFMRRVQNGIIKAVKSSRFTPPGKFEDTKANSEGYVSPGNKMGEGWLLTAEMLELLHSGVNNIVCAQPFGCLPNHIVGKGMIRKIRNAHPEANIVAVDYDPGATAVNQENRLKLMLSTARGSSTLASPKAPSAQKEDENTPLTV